MSSFGLLPPSYPQGDRPLSTYLDGLVRSAEHRLAYLRSCTRLDLGDLVRSASMNGDAYFFAYLPTLHSRHSPLSGKLKAFPALNTLRTPEENEVFLTYLNEAANIPNENTSWFIHFIESISSDIRKEPSPIRRTYNVITRPTHEGDYWRFIPYSMVRNELARLHAFLADAWCRETCYVASIFIGAFLAIHPFRDGNGRTSRILFNLILNRSSTIDSQFYIPIKELMQFSHSGFELSMREANITGRWSPLIAFVCRTVILVSDLAMQHRPTNSLHHNSVP